MAKDNWDKAVAIGQIISGVLPAVSCQDDCRQSSMRMDA